MEQRDRIVAYVQNRYGVEPECLWAKYPNYVVFRQPASRKWFGIIMDLPRNRMGLEGDGLVDVMDVKCGPLMVGNLLAQDGFLPAYHMSKSSWISILLDETVPDDQIFPLLELSYDSVAPKRKKGLAAVFLPPDQQLRAGGTPYRAIPPQAVQPVEPR